LSDFFGNMRNKELIHKKTMFDFGNFFYRKWEDKEELIVSRTNTNTEHSVRGIYFIRNIDVNKYLPLIKKKFFLSNCGTNCCWNRVQKEEAQMILEAFRTKTRYFKKL